MKIKKILAVLLAVCVVLSLSSFYNIAKGATEMSVDYYNSENTPIVGSFIRCENVMPAAANITANDMGMSGMRAPNHLHNTAAEYSYLGNSTGLSGAVTYTFSQVEALGYIYVWNYNGGNTKSGMKDVKIEYSVDNLTWFSLGSGEYQLTEATASENTNYGGNAANNQNDRKRTPIDFKGVPAKYVRIIPISNHGGSGYGLSEVRFFRYKTRPTDYSALAATATAPLSNSKSANMLTSGAGLSDLYSNTATHSNLPADMWKSESTAQNSFVVIDLEGNYPLRSLAIWNYNDPQGLDNGMQNVKIEYTVKSPNKIDNGVIDYAGGDWQTLGTYTLPKGTGEAHMPSSLTIDLENKHAAYIKITPETNHGSTGYGLSAVRLFCGNGYAVEPSIEWTGMFSNEGNFPYQISAQNGRDGYGWLSADGVYSVHMNGGDMPGAATKNSKTVFLFSDTAVGNFKNFSGTYGKHGDNMSKPDMRNHSMATLTGNTPDPRNLQFYLHSGNDYGNIFGRTSWAQELVKIDNKLYSWAMEFSGWDPSKYDLVEFDIAKDGFPVFNKKPAVTDGFPILVKDGIYRYDFSAALLDNTASGGSSPAPDGYIYIYGMKSWNDGFWTQKAPIAARVLPSEFKDINKWRFWNGSAWDADIKKSENINTNGSDVSSEYSVSFMENGLYAGKYIMVYTKDTMFNELCFRVGDTPIGPFGDGATLRYSPDVAKIIEQSGVGDGYTYNGKAHPHLSNKGELLMSYNVNSPSYSTAMEFLHPQFLVMFTIAPYKSGDVNGDGRVNLSDIMRQRSAVLGKPLSDEMRDAADLDSNGTVDVNDVMLLRKRILKI